MSKVLLVEDDRDQIMMYQLKFEQEGFYFMAANNGDDGWQATRGAHPDCILLDLVLVNESGLDVLERLKKDEKTKDIPVIMLTNLDKKDMREKSKALGAVDFLIKTQVDPADLVTRVEKIIEAHRRVD